MGLRMVRLLVGILFAFLLSNELSAQQDFLNTCDPTKPDDCESIAKRYLPWRVTNEENTAVRLIPEDQDRAQTLFDMALVGAREGCELGDPEHCNELVWLSQNEFVNISDEQKVEDLTLAISTLETGCASGNVNACRERVMVSANISSLGPNYRDVVLKIFARDEEFGFLSAYVQGIAQNRVEQISPACESGDVAACIELGEIFDTSVPKSPRPGPATIQRSVELRLDACLLGSHRACDTIYRFFVNYHLADPSNISDSHHERFRRFVTSMDESCEQGNAEACYAYVAHVPDKKTRLELSMRACNAGYERFCKLVGWKKFRAYAETPEQTDLLQTAVEYWGKGCDLGDAFSCHTLEHIAKS